MSDGETVLERLREQPGGVELQELAAKDGDLALVGGAVRDLLLGRTPRELDVVAGQDTQRIATELAARLAHEGLGGHEDPEGPELTLHERFGTAVVRWPGGRIDLARRRAESYPAPGALPEVRPGSPEEDLARRDFTVNAIAVPIAGPHAGELLQAEHGSEDLRAGRLRVLHEQSFIDDPTRLLRLGRYQARLGFAIEPETRRLARAALEAGALSSVTGSRLGAELRLALGEPDAPAALGALTELGVLPALGLAGTIDPALARSALALLPSDGHGDELMLALLLHATAENAGARAGAGAGEGARAELRAVLDRFDFGASERDRALGAALGADALAERIAHSQRRSQLHEALAGEPPEAIAMAAALAGRGKQAKLWFEELRHVRLQISGDDLLAAGLAPGPEIGTRLKAALARKLDGELAVETTEGELRAALGAGS